MLMLNHDTMWFVSEKRTESLAEYNEFGLSFSRQTLALTGDLVGRHLYTRKCFGHKFELRSQVFFPYVLMRIS